MSSTDSRSLREVVAGPAIRQDAQLVGILVAMVLAVLGGASVIAVLPLSHRAIYYIVGVYVVHVPVLIFGLWRLNRHRYSDAAGAAFLVVVLAWAFWNMLIWWVSVLSGWFSDRQPAYHLVIGAAFGALPLLFVIWKLRDKLRSAS